MKDVKIEFIIQYDKNDVDKAAEMDGVDCNFHSTGFSSDGKELSNKETLYCSYMIIKALNLINS